MPPKSKIPALKKAEKKIEKKVAKKVVKKVVKRAVKARQNIDFVQLSRNPGAGWHAKRMRDVPEVFRAKLLALSQKFPMMMPNTVGTGDTYVGTDTPVAPLSSLNRGSATFITVASPVAGTNYFYSAYFFWGAGFLTQKIWSAATMTTDGTFDTYSKADDNLYSLLTTISNTQQTNAMCARIMNASPLMNIGGEILMGTIPSGLVTSSLSWSTLQSYIDVKQVDMPMAQDVCFPWLPICPADDSTAFLTGTPSAGNNYSVLFFAIRVPYSASFAPALDWENYNNYTVNPAATYEKIIDAKVQPIQDAAYIAARRVIGTTNKSSLQIENTSNVGAAFSAAAKALGPSVAAYVGKKLPKWIDSVASAIGGLFTTRRLTNVAALLDQSDKKNDLAVLDDMVSRGLLPGHFADCVRSLFEYRVRFSRDAVMIEHSRFPEHLAQLEEEKHPFGLRTRTFVRQPNLDEDEKEFDKLSSTSRRPLISNYVRNPEDKSARSSSVPR